MGNRCFAFIRTSPSKQGIFFTAIGSGCAGVYHDHLIGSEFQTEALLWMGKRACLEAQKIAARRRLERGRGANWFLICVARLFSQSLSNSDDLQQRLTAFAVIGQDHESMPITAAVHYFIREQEVPLVQPVRHIQRLDGQLLRLADGTASGLEHG